MGCAGVATAGAGTVRAHRPAPPHRLFLDAFNGNHALFVRDDEVRAAWAWIDSVSEAWKAANLPMEPYPAGSWGPQQAHEFLPAAIVADNRVETGP